VPKLVIIIHGTAISDNITISQINTKKPSQEVVLIILQMV